MKSLVIHSHKGGVGKSTLTVNIAVELAKTHRVFIIDNDLAGPSLQTFFNHNASSAYLNKYLQQKVEFSECIQEYKDHQLNGKLFYTISDPSNKSVDSMLRIDKKSATTMLRQLVSMKKFLESEYKIDYFIVDTSPGVNIVAANAFIVTKNILFVNKLSNADIDGSASMISGILQYMDNNVFMVANQIPPVKVKDDDEKEKLMSLIEKHLASKIEKKVIKVVGVLPMDFNLQLKEFESAQHTMYGNISINIGRSDRHIYALDEPNCAFSKNLKSVIRAVFGE